MSSALRHRTVAVAVIYDEPSQSFLLWHNKRWHGYAFPMKHFEPCAGIDSAKVALSSLDGREIPLSLPHATASPLDRHGECEYSEGVRQYTYYDYHVFAVDPGQSLTGTNHDPDLRWLTYDQLLAAENVTSSTKSIARSLIEDRRVAIALISREGARGREFLLLWNKNYQYFFPATRLKDDVLPAQAALQAVRNDLGYDGPVDVIAQDTVDALQESPRFGKRQIRFHFSICLLNLPGLQLAAAGNDLEKSLMALPLTTTFGTSTPSSPGWRWFSEADLRNRSDMSSSVDSVLATVLQLAEKKR